MSMQKRVLHFIKNEKLWNVGDRVCVAVSGGVDSMVLMHILHRTQRAHGGILEVCTIDHQFRSASKEECAFVVQEARRLGLLVHAVKLDIPNGGNLYERARIERQKVLKSIGCDVIATGHHQADQAETLLYRLLRGSGLDGLSAMKPVHSGWCRPLLSESKEEILSFAKKEGLQWYEDPSNAHSMRGKLRRLLSDLDSIHGASIPAIARTASLLSEDAMLLNSYTNMAWNRCTKERGLCLQTWKKEPKGMQLRLLKKLCLENRVAIRAQILQQFQKNPVRVQLPKGFWLLCVDGLILIQRH